MASKSNKTTTQARDSQIIAGITKDLKNGASMPLAGSTYTPVTLITLIQSRINAMNAVAAARANWLSQAKACDALNTQVDEVETGLKQYVLNLFGKTSPQLADFGFTAPKRTPLTTEQKQEAIQKGKATRLARGTLTKKQKAQIKGTIATPAQPAASTAPATPAAATAPTPATPTLPTQAPAGNGVAQTAPPKS